MSARTLSAYGLRRGLIAGIRRVIAQRDEINRINVYPVADHDTGTNLAFTLGAVLQGVRGVRFASAREVLRCVAAEAIDGSRGNSGAIMAHFFQGMAEGLAPGASVTTGVLATATMRGAAEARTAMAEPREGTMLSVMQTFADEMQAQAVAGVSDVRVCFGGALVRAREALRRTQGEIRELRAAGVVDAGARGFVELLEGIAEFIDRGPGARESELPVEMPQAGVEVCEGTAEEGRPRWFVECAVSAEAVERGALKAALLALPLARLVITGTRGRVRLHAHVGDAAEFFATAARFGAVSREKAVELNAHMMERRVAIVTDSGADLPAEAVERLDLHVVPQRLSIGGKDFVDGVTISTREFYDAMRGPVMPRTSQPPPGEFRRMFEFLLENHERVIDVSLGRTLSGTLQSAAGAAARTDAARVSVFDTCNAAAAQGLLAIWAAEAAEAGLGAERILEGLARLRPRTTVFGVIRDIRYGVRGGRVPKVALPLTRWLRLSLLIRSRAGGKLGLMGGLWGGKNLPERFARKVARTLTPGRCYRFIVSHCDCAEDGERVRAALRACVENIESIALMETGVAVGAHAGPGSLVIGVQEYERPQP